jgi:hypothetical protein
VRVVDGGVVTHTKVKEISHSDQGSQFASCEWQTFLKQNILFAFCDYLRQNILQFW